MAGMRIVVATASHAEALADLEAAAFGRAAVAPVRELQDPRYLHWLAIAPAQATIAEVAVGYLQAMWLPDALDILAVATAPTLRRQGIGAALVTAAVAAASAQGVPSVTLEVAARNLPARALYEGLGFAAEGVRRRYYPARNGEPEDDAVLMALRLA